MFRVSWDNPRGPSRPRPPGLSSAQHIHRRVPARLQLLRIAALLAGLALAAEVALRMAAFSWPSEALRFVVVDPAEDVRIRAGDSSLRFDRDQLWTPVEGALVAGARGERYGRDGMLGPLPEFERTPGVMRVAVLGANATVAPQLDAAQRWPRRMQAALAERGLRCETINAAVEGHSPRQGLERWRATVRPWRPDIVVVAYSMANACMPALASESDAQRIALVRARPELLAAWRERGIGDRLRLFHAVRWMAAACFDDAYWQGRAAWFDERRGLADWQLVEWPGTRRVMPHELHDAATALAREIRAAGAEPLFLPLPPAPAADIGPIRERYLQFLQLVCAHEGARLLDGRAILLAARDGLQLHDENGALNECGHELIGMHAAAEVQRMQEARR